MTLGVVIGGVAAASVVLLGVAFAGGPGRRSLERLVGEHRGHVGSGTPVVAPSTRRRAAASSALGGVAGWLVAGPPGLIAGAVAGGLLPYALERRRAGRTARAIEEQLIDAVTAISAALRSGRSLAQALASAGEEIGAPMSELLRGSADRAGLGVPMDEVLDSLADHIGTADARLVTGVLRLHRRTGGTLAASLDEVARTLRSRRDGARELRSLTAQARLSASILGLLPFGFFLFLSVVARRDVESAYRTTAGASAIGLGLALQGAAFVWIRRLLRVEEA